MKVSLDVAFERARVTLGGAVLADVSSIEYARPSTFTWPCKIRVPFVVDTIVDLDEGWARERELAGLREAAERGRRIAARRAEARGNAVELQHLASCREVASGQPKRVRMQVARALERLRRSAARAPSVRRCALDVWRSRSRST